MDNYQEDPYHLTADQERWVKNRSKRYRIPRDYLKAKIIQQRDCCAWSGIPLRFELVHLNPPTDHIAAVVDHSSPGSNKEGFSIVCHYLNDAKNKMPYYLFESLRETYEWKYAMERMRAQYQESPENSLKIITKFIRKDDLPE